MMTVIEQRTMDAIQSMNRKMKDRSGIDWEQRRYEIARDMLSAFLSNDNPQVYAGTYEAQAKDAVKYADALIKELKK